MDFSLLLNSVFTFFSLAMAIISVWVKPSTWIWGSFLIIAFGLGYLAKIFTPIALFPIGGLLILHAILKGDVRGLARFVLVILTAAISIGLLAHLLPGFHNWNIVNHFKLSADSTPFTLFLNFDKPFIGFFVLALGFPLIRNLRDFGNLMKVAIPLTLCGVVILATLALYSGLIRWDPKLPRIFWFFAIENLIFVCIIEEAFWRGFLQNEFSEILKRWKAFGSLLAVIITAILFTILHYFWVPSIPFLSLVFVAGLIYGGIYQLTDSLEASIFCHWVFNLIHFVLFTYPVLQNAL